MDDPQREGRNGSAHREAHRILSQWEQLAEAGFKLNGIKRLKAALHLGRAWRTAKTNGLSKDTFQDRVFARLRHKHGRRESFKLANFTLPVAIDQITPGIVERYNKKPEPLRSFEPYLVGLAVAAEHCGIDGRDWKLALLQDLDLRAPSAAPLPAANDDIPFENLALLLRALCRSVATREGLDASLRTLTNEDERSPARWDIFDEQLHPETKGVIGPFYSPIYPVNDIGTYFEETLPFPSVPLLRIPYLVGQARFRITPFVETTAPEPTLVENAASEHEGKLIYLRELRLCIVPDGKGDYTAALESRPRVEALFLEPSRLAGRHFVKHAIDPDLQGGFYSKRPATITLADASEVSIERRIIRDRSGDEDWVFADRAEHGGRHWIPDPLNNLTNEGTGDNYISYTLATPDYLRFWFASWEPIAGEREVCPWAPADPDIGLAGLTHRPDIPPLPEFNFPQGSHLTWIEAGLHDGSLEQALAQAAARVGREVRGLQLDRRRKRDDHVQALLDRWQGTPLREDL